MMNGDRLRNALFFLVASLVFWLLIFSPSEAWLAAADDRPNILWLSCEDMGAHLRCYGDEYAETPHIDELASQSVRFTRAFATAPVCSPARSCLITGMYATSLGTQHVRSAFPIPEEFHGFPTYLRRIGYYCTNNVKTDYNVANEPAIIRESWDDSSEQAHWRNRPAEKPFFCVFNFMETHQSRSNVWSFEEFEENIGGRLEASQRHDPAKAPVPPYYPDTPLVRRTIARYYDCITAMDQGVGQILQDLERDGLADKTIVFFFSDHGMGMPRGKRTLYDSGLHVPLLVRCPERYRKLLPVPPGASLDRLVSFVDFPPTVLSLVGAEIPRYMQGVPFLGSAAGEPRDFVFGARDRVDEAYELSRSIRDQRYLYIRNYMPHLSWNQSEGYSDSSAMRRQITQLAEEGKLNREQLTYAGSSKSLEELYDTISDPHQLHNLALSAEQQPKLSTLRKRLERWILETRDLGFLPEWEVWRRSRGTTPWNMARGSDRYDLPGIMAAADLVGRPHAVEKQIGLLSNADSAVRYWGAVGLHAAGADASEAREELRNAWDDPAAPVRIEAAATLAALGDTQNAIPALVEELNAPEPEVQLRASRALQRLGANGIDALPALRQKLEEVTPRKEEDPFLFLFFSLDAAVKKLEAMAN